MFTDVMNDAKGLEQKLLGPTYSYADNIKTPEQLGISSTGTLSALGNNINGVIDYTELLVTGVTPASATGQPLGDKFFLQTFAKCIDSATNQSVDRYIYFNNVPSGNIPFLSSTTGKDFNTFRGLIPGVISDLSILNPMTMMRSLMSGANPPCQEITLQVIDPSNNKSMQTNFMTNTDISDLDPCSIPGNYNPITKKSCQEAFYTYFDSVNNNNNNNNKDNKKREKTSINDHHHHHHHKMKEEQNMQSPVDISKDKLIQFYFTSLFILLIYILFCYLFRR